MHPVLVGILSIGDMGLGIAKLLQAHDYRVLTVGLGRRYGSIITEEAWCCWLAFIIIIRR